MKLKKKLVSAESMLFNIAIALTSTTVTLSLICLAYSTIKSKTKKSK